MTCAESPELIPELFAEASGDAAALGGLLVDDVDFVNVVGLWWQNKIDIQRAHQYGLTTFFKGSRLSARHVEIRQLGDTVAVVHVRWRLAGQLDKDSTPLNDQFTVMVFVAELSRGDWRVVAAHNTDIIPGSETYIAKGDLREAADHRQ